MGAWQSVEGIFLVERREKVVTTFAKVVTSLVDETQETVPETDVAKPQRSADDEHSNSNALRGRSSKRRARAVQLHKQAQRAMAEPWRRRVHEEILLSALLDRTILASRSHSESA